eukprot:CAMPEP_0169419450 /NCGR_PEP_ID=MMETSP1017-20121227/64976_1 /TAXON_ID=342587 /ORGANISM="Karlodinium micrum, Strain CCMP2283" /LENGTH=445 /DNA_ID=CAMNT_0009528093 /DNA_START=89 /DNA_END=1422 /DNA_ORIENTATION=+
MGCGATSASAYRVGASTDAAETSKRDSKKSDIASKSGVAEEKGTDAEATAAEEEDSFAITDTQGNADRSKAANQRAAAPKKVVRQGTGSLDQTSAAEQAAQKHANYMKRKQQRKARRQKQAQTEGNAFIPRNGFLSNEPEMDVCLIILACLRLSAVEDVEEIDASEHLTAVQEFSSTMDFSEEDSLPVGGMVSLSQSLAGHSSLAISASPTSSLAIIASPRSSSIPLSAETCSPRSSPEQQLLSKSSSSIKVSEPGTYRCICPVPYPWGKLNNKEGRKFAKLVFRPLVDKQRIPSFDSMLEASSTVIVFALHVDSVDGSPSLDQQLDNMLRVLRLRRQSSREMRAKWAVILWTRFCDDTVGISQEKWSSWMKQIEDFELVNGSMWRFDLIDVREIDKGDRLFAAFAKIASQRIYTNLNPCGECWESEASLKQELDDRGSDATEEE